MDYVTLIVGLVLFVIACVLDINSSTEMKRYGIKERNSLVADKNGDFSIAKGLVFVIGPAAAVILVFLFFPKEEASGWDRVYAGLFLLPGAALHWWAARRNNKLIAERKRA